MGLARIFFKTFTIATFTYIEHPNIVQNFKEVLTVDSGKKVYEVLGQEIPHFGVKRSFFQLITITTFIYILYPIIIQNYKKVLTVDSDKKCTRFYFQFRVKCPILWTKFFLKNYSLLLPLLTYKAKLSCKISQKSLMSITRTRRARFLVLFDIKLSHFGVKKSFFQNIQYCQLCLLIVLYCCAKFQKYP